MQNTIMIRFLIRIIEKLERVAPRGRNAHKRYEFDAPPASFVDFELIDLNCENHFVEFELIDLNCENHFAWFRIK